MRAGSGLLLTTEMRAHAANHHKDVSETTQRLARAHEIHHELGDAADHLHAQQSEQLDVARALQSQLSTLKGHGRAGEFRRRISWRRVPQASR